MPDTRTNRVSLAAWMFKESGLGPSGAAFNPINTTLPAPGSTPFNDIKLSNGQVIHVQNYVSCDQGLEYTAKTINFKTYSDIRNALSKEQSIQHAGSLKSWGTTEIPDSAVAAVQSEVQ